MIPPKRTSRSRDNLRSPQVGDMVDIWSDGDCPDFHYQARISARSPNDLSPLSFLVLYDDGDQMHPYETTPDCGASSNLLPSSSSSDDTGNAVETPQPIQKLYRRGTHSLPTSVGDSRALLRDGTKNVEISFEIDCCSSATNSVCDSEYHGLPIKERFKRWKRISNRGDSLGWQKQKIGETMLSLKTIEKDHDELLMKFSNEGDIETRLLSSQVSRDVNPCNASGLREIAEPYEIAQVLAQMSFSEVAILRRHCPVIASESKSSS